MLFGEHLAESEFRVAEVTTAGKGSIATFMRSDQVHRTASRRSLAA
jgi:hypothetical protein